MKVIKVIVKDLPESCWDCPFSWSGIASDWRCSIMEMAEDPEEPEDWDIKMDGRPNWCPLGTVDEIPIAYGNTTLDFSDGRE